MVGTPVEKLQMTEVGLSENLISQILNNDDLLILTNDLQDDVNLAATIGVLPTEFAMKEDQPIQLDSDVLAKKAAWATLADDTNTTGDHLEKKGQDDIEEVIKFESPSWQGIEATLHKGLHKWQTNQLSVDRLWCHNECLASGNPEEVGQNLQRFQRTNMKMTNFTGESTNALGFYIAKLIVGTKTFSTVFFYCRCQTRILSTSRERLDSFQHVCPIYFASATDVLE